MWSGTRSTTRDVSQATNCETIITSSDIGNGQELVVADICLSIVSLQAGLKDPILMTEIRELHQTLSSSTDLLHLHQLTVAT